MGVLGPVVGPVLPDGLRLVFSVALAPCVSGLPVVTLFAAPILFHALVTFVVIVSFALVLVAVFDYFDLLLVI